MTRKLNTYDTQSDQLKQLKCCMTRKTLSVSWILISTIIQLFQALVDSVIIAWAVVDMTHVRVVTIMHEVYILLVDARVVSGRYDQIKLDEVEALYQLIYVSWCP